MSHPGTYILAEQQERNHAVPYHDDVNENSMEMGKRKPIQYGKRKVSTFLANEEKKRLLKSGKDITFNLFSKRLAV